MSGLGILVAILMMFMGILLLKTSWTRKHKSALYKIAGWALILSSFIPFSFYVGADVAAAFVGIAFVLVGFIIVLRKGITVTNSIQKTTREKEKTITEKTDWKTILRRVYLFLLAGPVAISAAIMLAISIYGFTDDKMVPQNSLVLTFFVFPIIWAIILIACLNSSSLKKKSLVAFLSAGAGYAGIFLTSTGAI